MIFIAFGRWSTAAGPGWFIRERIYWRGYRWTPFVRVRRRYPLAMHLADILPRRVVYYAMFRAWAEATTGHWSHEDATSVMVSDVVKRWKEAT